MSDLIRRQDAIDTAVTIARRMLLDPKPMDVKMSSDYLVENLFKPMRKLPSAQPKTGKWIFGHTLGHSWMKCSECLVSQDGQTACFSYCPNCGARIEGE